MNQYLCQFCYRIVTYGENHPCLIYKNDDNVYFLPRLHETDKKHDDDTEFSKEYSMKICSSVQQTECERTEPVHLQPIENKEKLSCTAAWKRKRKCMTNSERTSKNVHLRNPQNASFSDFILTARTNEGHSKENASLKASSDYERTSLVSGPSYEQKKSGSKFSNYFHAKDIDGYGMSPEESKWQSFNRAKYNFMDFLETATKNASSDKIISGSSNSLLNSDLLPLKEEPDNDMIGALGELKDDSIPHEVPSVVHNNKEETLVNEDVSICFVKEDSVVAGPFRERFTKKKYACEFCPKKFNFQSRLNSHRRMHTGEKPFVCDICGKEFTQKGNHNMHYRMHTEEKPFVCDICGKEFIQKRNHDRHYRMHTEEKPFVCDICGKEFTQKGNHDRHYRMHTGEKPFVCDKCGKDFPRKDKLDNHYRTHTGEKPFLCDVCGNSFTQKSNLTKHIRTHSGEKPYKCAVLGMAFADIRNCKRHHSSSQ